MKKGRRGKKTGGARLKTQVSSLRRQVKALIKAPEAKGQVLKTYKGMLLRRRAFPTEIAAGGASWDTDSVVDESGNYCFSAGSAMGRTFPEFRLMPFVESSDDIFPFVMKGNTMDLRSVSLSFDAIWPANIIDPVIYQSGFDYNHTSLEDQYWADKCNPDVEFLLLRYDTPTGKTKALGASVTKSSHVFEDQEFEDNVQLLGFGTKVDHNVDRKVYAGTTFGYNPHKKEGWENVHIVDRKVVKFPQTKIGDMMEIVPPQQQSGVNHAAPLYLNPQVKRRVTLGVSYKKGKKIELNPIPKNPIIRGTNPLYAPYWVDGTGESSTNFGAEAAAYWTTVCSDNGFAVVARYAGTRLGSTMGNTGNVANTVLEMYLGDHTTNELVQADYIADASLTGSVGRVLNTIQWQNAKFTTKYYDSQ